MLLRLACAALLALASARNIVRQNTDTSRDVTVTTTVTHGATSTVSETTTIFKTVFSTILVTKTEIATVTETKKDVATATSVIYTTVTQNAKRWINAEPVAVVQPEVPPPTLTAEAAPGSQMTPIKDSIGIPNVELVRRGVIAKRATVTTTVTVTADDVTTVFHTISSTVVSTTSSETTSMSTITTTTFENAKATVTVTSTIFLRTTTVTTGPAETVASLPPDANIGTSSPQPTDTPNSGSGSSKKKSGLSTGAKAGIGAAAGVVGLAFIIAVAMSFWKQHKNKPKVTDDGTGMGMSEVPVGGIGTASTPGAGTDPRFTPSPVTSTLPTGSPVYNTSGPAELGGVSKKPDAEMAGDELPKFPEADGRPAMSHQSGPIDPDYEMPAQ